MNRRRSSIRAVSLAAIVAVSLGPLRALQEPKGESDDPGVDPEGRAGPYARFVFSLAVDPLAPGTLYAGTGGGVFKSASGVVKSSDKGASWMAAVTGLTNSFVTTLAIDPTSPSWISAGTDAGIFVSLDAAETWKPLTPGWGNGQ